MDNDRGPARLPATATPPTAAIAHLPLHHARDAPSQAYGPPRSTVLLNAFSLLQLLKPFELTGKLIKTIIEIMRDIGGFVVVLLVLLWCFSVCFAVSMPDNVVSMTA